MELLTKQGWTSAYSIEALITQIAATLVKGKVAVVCLWFSTSFRFHFEFFQKILFDRSAAYPSPCDYCPKSLGFFFLSWVSVTFRQAVIRLDTLPF